MPELRKSSITGRSKYFPKDFSRQNARNILSKIKVNMQQKKTNLRGASTTTTKYKMDLFVTKANAIKPLNFVIKSSILDFAVVPETLLNVHCKFKHSSIHFASLEF